MNKQQAIDAMRRGHKVTHRFFGDKEWLKMRSDFVYEFEDGFTCSASEFWKYRIEATWNEDWEIFDEN